MSQAFSGQGVNTADIGGKSPEVPVALAHMSSAEDGTLEATVSRLLNCANITVASGTRVLLKPNLLRANPLACTDAKVVAAVASWLLEHGAKVQVSDSPGFGSAAQVAASIGLSAALKDLHLTCTPLKDPVWKKVKVEGRMISLPISRTVLENDLIISVAKVKAHSQLGLTLTVKNCFGCVPGVHKAFMHTLYGKKGEVFAGILASLLEILPPVAGVCDGICAMHVNGPGYGRPYQLGLLGASSSPILLDQVLSGILGVKWEDLPLGRALARRFADVFSSKIVFPLAAPDEWKVRGFIVPSPLLTMSFAPHRLFISCLKRLWARFHAQ